MTTEEYYIAPSDEIFEDIKASAIKLWKTFDNEYGYVDGKLERIKNIQNISDNAWYIVAMFDGNNQLKLLNMVQRADTKTKLREVLIFGGALNIIFTEGGEDLELNN